MADLQSIKPVPGPIILPYRGKRPNIHLSAWIAPGAVVTGDTEIGPESSVWFGCVLRGDVNRIRIGCRVNIQDGVICHVEIATAALTIQDSVSVGHAAVLHGCTLQQGSLIGIGARVLNHAVIGTESLIAAGSVVREGTLVPPGELWAGIPAVKKRELNLEERKALYHTAERYAIYRLHYMGQDVDVPEHLLPKQRS